MPKWKILAVDDEPSILAIIHEILDGDACEVVTAANVAQAWEAMDQPGTPFSLIILDRRMPGVDGLELLRRVKGDSRFSSLPVIIQSGASSPDEIAEGIEAGAYYYLTKPYSPNTLLCIVRAVMADIELRAEASEQAARYAQSLKYFTHGELSFSTLEDVNNVAGILAALCPDPDRAASGLAELLLNAVEHGNLGISYEDKKRLMYDDLWESELNRRLALEENAGRIATVSFHRNAGFIKFRISDQGKGFDWKQYLELDPNRSLDPNGRGIAMSRRYSFSSVEYEGEGAVVNATVAL